MPQPTRHQSAKLFCFGLIQKKLTCRAALAMLSPEKSVLRATFNHPQNS